MLGLPWPVFLEKHDVSFVAAIDGNAGPARTPVVRAFLGPQLSVDQGVMAE
jgi:hypothetical protein